jgi:cytochrome c oxidase subunit I
MVTYDSPDNSPEAPAPRFLVRTLFSTDHKVIGKNYLWLALFSILLGMLLSLLIRIDMVWPGAHISFLWASGNTPGRYSALTLLHGSLMVFMVLTTAPQAGFGNYFLPLQIGARQIAFPSWNVCSFWATVVSFIGITTAFFIPLESGLSLWTVSVALFSLAGLLNAINFAVTTIDLRAKGMDLPRMPLTAWAWFINAILSMLIFSILLAACVFLISDRDFGSHFFSTSSQASSIAQAGVPLLWQQLFWFFAQALVYVAVLPCFGIVSHLLSTFSRRRVPAERAVVLALCGVGVFGFCVWGEHMFSSGLNPWSPLVFSVLASSLGIPASVLLVSWFATIWNAKIRLNTATLFALGFVSLFLAGGLSGLFLARNDIAPAAVNDDFITGHFHLVMGVAATFAILGALFFWFPKMFGRCLNETLGKVHFWLTFAGVYCVFMPMHWLGLISDSGVASGSGQAALRDAITVATILTVAAQAVFVFNFAWSLWRSAKTSDLNPWRSTTLEWSVPSPPPSDNFGAMEPVVYRGAYEFGAATAGADEDFVTQHVPPGQIVKVR